MTYTVSITSQGQISIPVELRKKLGLNKKSKAIVSEQEGKLVVEPVKDLLKLRGSLKSNKRPIPNDKLHDLFGQFIADEYANKVKKTK